MNRRGQIAVGFLVIAAFTLLLVRMTINLGQMAQVRTETSNAADAGALAAASWIASGENEAALIAGRMLDLVNMVQAIYIVPFCPGDGARAYANRLWASLYASPAGIALAQGPVWYLQDVADAAMISAWNVGRREFFTAAVNNMILRYNTGPVGYVATGGFAIDVDGNFPQEIRFAQEGLYDGNYANSTALGWNNGLPSTDPRNLKHSAEFDSNYPSDPPRLNMGCNANSDPRSSQATYYQYKPKQAMPIWPASIFDCDFVGVGITNTDVDGPVVDFTKAGDLPENPLAMVKETLTIPFGLPVPGLVSYQWVKAWDTIPFAKAIPSFEHGDLSMRLNVGFCPDHVCGIEPRQTACAPVVPLNIVDGAGSIQVTVSHDVRTQTGVSSSVMGAIPEWRPRFQRVESTATADYTAASTLPPSPNAKATLQSSN